MRGVLWRIGSRAAVCAGASWLAYRLGQGVVLATTAPLWGLMLARPLVDLASEGRHAMRRAVWRSVEGRHFAYRGRPMRVIDDADHRRWIRLEDLRAIIGHATSDAVLARSYPGGWQAFGTPPEPYLSDEALALHLAKASTPELLRFRHWVESEVVFPARRERRRLGIRTSSPRDAPQE